MTGWVRLTCWRLSLGVAVLAWLFPCSADGAAPTTRGANHQSGKNGGTQFLPMNGLQGGMGNPQQTAAMIAQERQMIQQLQQLIQLQQQMLRQQGRTGQGGIGAGGLSRQGGNGVNGANRAGVLPNQRTGAAAGGTAHTAHHKHKK